MRVTLAAAEISGRNSTSTLEGILHDAASQSPMPLVVVILYDLPNRDCHAKASNGEICCTYNDDGTCDYTAAGNCAAGLAEYMTTYVDPFAKVVGQYSRQGVPIAVIVEPDSLPNLATNTGDPRCGNSATTAAYTTGITYAVTALNTHAPSASLYLDAAHGGWMGWEDNAGKFARQIQTMNIAPYIRGFSSNVANYQALGVPCPPEAFEGGASLPDWCKAHSGDACCRDPCGLLGQYNAGNNELNYVQTMSKAVAATVGANFEPKWLIDTGRNGVPDERQDCSNWCNIRGAGVGHRPTTNTSLPRYVDALFFLKTPGESDGCTQSLPGGVACPRFDEGCASPDSIGSQPVEPRAPEAGGWFDYQIKQLADNAALGGGPSPSPSPTPTPPSPSACPGGTLAACIDQCPSATYSQCVASCAANCPSSAMALATTPSVSRLVMSGATPTAVVKPFGPCQSDAAATACTAGYTCESGLLCMPTATKRAERMHNSVFRTSWEHAVERMSSMRAH